MLIESDLIRKGLKTLAVNKDYKNVSIMQYRAWLKKTHKKNVKNPSQFYNLRSALSKEDIPQVLPVAAAKPSTNGNFDEILQLVIQAKNLLNKLGSEKAHQLLEVCS